MLGLCDRPDPDWKHNTCFQRPIIFWGAYDDIAQTEDEVQDPAFSRAMARHGVDDSNTDDGLATRIGLRLCDPRECFWEQVGRHFQD